MDNKISISKAIWIGTLTVTGPVLILLCGPLLGFDQLVRHGVIARSHNWIGLMVLVASFVLAWLWWSLTIPKWRLWAYDNVDDIPALKKAAVKAGLTWPDGHIFSRTEIKSDAQRIREQKFDSALQDETDAL